MRKVFIWRPSNIRHIAKHAVTPAEAKYVVEHASRPYPQRVGRNTYIIRGRTARGRYLQVIYLRLGDDEVDVELLDLIDRVLFESGNEVVYVIHAMDTNPPRKKSR